MLSNNEKYIEKLGNNSEPEIKINSSVNACVDVTESKQKDSTTENFNDHKICSDKDTEVEIEAEVAAPVEDCYEATPKVTRILYKTGSHGQYHVDRGAPAPDAPGRGSSSCRAEPGRERATAQRAADVKSEYKLRKRKSRRGAGDPSHWTSTTFRSLAALLPEGGEGGRGERTARRLRRAYCDLATHAPVADSYETPEPLIRHEDVLRYASERKPKREFDEDFIARIIKKQYQPVQIFDKCNSDLSQYSVPVCRDRLHKLRRIKRETEMCCQECELVRDACDMRSACDARHSGRHRHGPRARPPPSGRYYDSALYDVVPVKEHSSPKSRRKFQEENINNGVHRNIPPSPKSHRPRLNLESRYMPDSDDGRQPARHRPDFDTEEDQAAVEDVKCLRTRSRRKQKLPSRHFIHPEDLYIPNLQSCQPALDASVDVQPVERDGHFCDEQPSANTDKTDKTLGEIKEILQNFLQELKKENISSSSVNKSETNTPVPGDDRPPAPDGLHKARMEFASRAANCDTTAIPPYNPCCYPVLPFYPMNYPVQNAYVLPGSSVACPMCAHSAESQLNSAQNKSSSNSNSLTRELIKEIYKCVAQKPANSFVHDRGSVNNRTRRSRKHDAQVGTPKLNCHSKSCEAFGPKIISATYLPKPQVTVSDSVLERRSVDQSDSQSSIESEISSEDYVSSVGEKNNKFKKILKSLGLAKKKKITKPAVESEESEHYPQKPFRQDVMSYMMHGQELYVQPPSARPAPHPAPPHASTNEYYTSGEPCCHPAMFQQHAPLCLKEIEVKSTATQSDYRNDEPKKSFFSSLKSKFQNAKMEHAVKDHYLTSATQTKPPKKEPEKLSPFFGNWNPDRYSDPLKESYNEQKLLATGQIKLRNDLLKKLFYKRNPFSPRNMLVKTLLGKDKASYGMPAGIFKPKMFV